MRLLDRNKQTIYYRNFSAKAITSESGLFTGEYVKTYGNVKTTRAYVKTAMGDNAVQPFGEQAVKNRIVYFENGSADINEYSQLWVGIDPSVTNGVPTVAPNYEVSGIEVGLNHTRASIRRVDESVN